MKIISTLLFLICTTLPIFSQVVITGVFDGPFSGGHPKFVELYVTQNETDLTGWLLRNHNNGSTSVSDITNLSGIYNSGDFIYVIYTGGTEEFQQWFELSPEQFSSLNTIEGSSPNVNGDDAISIFNGTDIIDVFGQIGIDGTGLGWEYLDGWAYRNNGTGPDGSVFVLENWSFSGKDALDGETSNSTAATPFPIGSYSMSTVTIPNPPIAISATNITNESFTANWNASSGSTNYFLDVSADSNFTTFLPGFENKDIGNVLSYSVNQLNPLTHYFYRVRANNSAGTSGNSNVIEVITLDVPNTTVQFVNSSGIVAENSGTYDISISILYPDNTNQTSVDLVLINGDPTDIDNYSTQTVTFPAGSSDNQLVTATVTDDGITEGNETLTFELQNVTGGKSATVGNPAQFNLTITELYSGNYYDTISSGATGEQLRFELHNLIKGHIEYPYSSYTTDVWDILMDADEDPENSSNVILIYTGRSQDKNYNASISSDEDAWNREHVWAKSRGDFGTDPPAGTDAHHLKAADASMNSTRSNKDFDDGGSPVYDSPTNTLTDCFTDSDSWEPRDEVKGDVARMLFYMDVRYEGEKGDPDLLLVNYAEANPDKDPEIGVLSTLLQWHQQDPPDPFEQRRNNIVYNYQQNRNPFIDHPEWVDLIWGANAPISPTITNLTRNVKVPNADQDLIIQADIQDANGSISLAEIRFSIDGGPYQQSQMTPSGVTFTGTIPESFYDNGNLLSYYVYTEDNEGNPKYGTVEDLFTGITEVNKIHSVNSNGVLEYKSIFAKVRGIATVGTFNFSNTSTDIFLQDETGGVNIYKNSDTSYNFIEGNDYTVTGIISQFNGKTEIIPEDLNVDVVNNGANVVPLPLVLTIDQILGNPEVYEGMLVKINNISKISGDWPTPDTNTDLIVSDNGGSSTLTLRVDKDTDLDDNLEPTWPKDITGIITQYDDLYPYNEVYQIQPRRMTDITNSVLVQIKIFLQGAYDPNTNEMKTLLNSSLPLVSPYDGRKLVEMPENIVDWVLVELRANPNGPAIASKSALLRKDGRIVNDDNSSVEINLPADNGQYYIVIKHRNHLAIMSSSAVQLNSTSSTLYDFTIN